MRSLSRLSWLTPLASPTRACNPLVVQPIIRAELEANPEMTVAEGKALLVRCLKVMYYRDARSLNKYHMATSTKDGCQIDEATSAETDWGVADFVQGYE